MNSETKIISIIGVITVIVIGLGVILAGNAQNNTGQPVALSEELLVRPDSARITGQNPQVQIVEFADFECPACQVLHPNLKKLLEEYGDKIDLVFRVIPIHAKSKELMAVAMSANEQGKFKEMHDLLFENSSEWGKIGLSDQGRLAIYQKYSDQLRLNTVKFLSDLNANRAKYYAQVDQDASDAQAMNIRSTPTLIINGTEVIKGVQSYEILKTTVEKYLNQ
jgi:protein-disulfide isomerase